MERVSRRSVGLGVGLVLLALGGGGIGLAALTRGLGRLRAEVAALEREEQARAGRLERLEHALAAVSDEVDRLEDDATRARAGLDRALARGAEGERDLAAVRGDLGRLEERLLGLGAALEGQSRLLAERRRDDDPAARLRDLLSPTARINARSEVGAGTVVWSRSTGSGALTYLLTAWHLVGPHHTGPGAQPLEVDLWEEGRHVRSERGRVVAGDERLDLALIEVRSHRPHPFLARLPAREELERVALFAPVHAVGCPLGYDPLVTTGELTSRTQEVEGRRYWMVSSPVIFGNSGGGVFLGRSHVMLGVLSRISSFKNMIDVPVPHMGLVVPLDAVYAWLDRSGYGFVHADRLADRRVEADAVPAASPPR